MKKILIILLMCLSAVIKAASSEIGSFQAQNCSSLDGQVSDGKSSSPDPIQKSIELNEFQERIKKAIVHLAGRDDPLENFNFSELKGGMTSAKLYTFEIDHKKYVLRTLSSKQNIESRQSEIMAHKIAMNMGIAPELTYVDEEFTFMIMPFIEGHLLTRNDLNDEFVLKSLGQMLQKLHQYKGDEFKQVRNQMIRTQKHYEKGLRQGNAYPSTYKKLYEDYLIEGQHWQKNSPVLSHGDLNPSNIIISSQGKIYLIDWTSATWENRDMDLGYFTFLNGLSDRQSHFFFNAYLQREPNSEEWAQFKLAQKRVAFLTATVWLGFAESLQEKTIPLSERVKKLDLLLSSKNLKLGQEYLLEEQIIYPLSGQYEAIKRYALGFLCTYINWN